MAIETEDDLLELLDVDEFGIDVILDPDSSATTIPAIFDAGFIAIDGDLLDVSSTETVLMCRTSDVTSVDADVTLIDVQGIRYRVGDIQPDGTGITVIRIHKVNE